MVRKHVSTNMIDANVLRKDYEWVKEQILKEKPTIVLGGFTPPTVKHDMKLGKIVKENSNAFFGIWGPIPGVLKQRLFNEYPNLPQQPFYQRCWRKSAGGK